MNEIKGIERAVQVEVPRPRFLLLAFTDINGSLKGMEIPMERYEEAVEDGGYPSTVPRYLDSKE